jgi:hypothetical protein
MPQRFEILKDAEKEILLKKSTHALIKVEKY